MGCSPEQSRANGKLGGRKPGSRNVRTRRRTLQVCREWNISPLDVMLDNMQHWRARSANLEIQLQQLIDSGADEQTIEQMRKSLLAAREQAQKCAVDAAPFLHPRLKGVATDSVQTEAKATFAEITGGMSDEEASRTYAEMLKENPPPV